MNNHFKQGNNRKAKQHNTTCLKQLLFKEKLAASGGTQTHDHQLSSATEAAMLIPK